MSHLSALFDRAETLRGHGLTERRIYGHLRNEFPNAERDVLLRAAKLEGSPTGVTPGWALWGQPLRPTQIRFQTKGAGRSDEDKVTVRTRKVVAVNYPLITVEANDVREGDWIEDVGLVDSAFSHKRWTFISLANDESLIYKTDAPVIVRLEDEGEVMEA